MIPQEGNITCIIAKLFDHEILEKHPVGLVSKVFT